MQSRTFPCLAAALLAGAGAHAAPDLSFRMPAHQLLTVAEIETALGVASTFRIDGIAVGPEISGHPTIFLVHQDTLALETFAQIDLTTKSAVWTKTVAALKTDLGGDYASEPTFPILVGELAFDAGTGASGTLYFADNSVGDEFAVIAVDIATGTASEVLAGEDVEGWNSHGVLSDGIVVGALAGHEHKQVHSEEPRVGYLDPADVAPAFAEVFDMDDFIAASLIVPPPAELPPEAIAVNPANDDVYVFCHDGLEIFRIEDIAGASPTLTPLDIAGWTGIVDLHGIASDADGNLFGFDEGTPDIEIYDATEDEALPPIALSTIASEIGIPAFEVTLWRGIKAQTTGASTMRLLLASADDAAGVVAIDFGTAPSSVVDWSAYQ